MFHLSGHCRWPLIDFVFVDFQRLWEHMLTDAPAHEVKRALHSLVKGHRNLNVAEADAVRSSWPDLFRPSTSLLSLGV